MLSSRNNLLVCGLALLGVGHSATAADVVGARQLNADVKGVAGQSFKRIATLANYLNNDDISAEVVSEIIAVTADGNTLVYTDGAGEKIGFIDISVPQLPAPAGTFSVGGEPTSVATVGNNLALVGINTSQSFTQPSGYLAVIDIAARQVIREIDLGGQPDATAISPDGQYAAIVIENERDEDIVIDGVEGGLPQLPAGYLVIVEIADADPTNWPTPRIAELTDLAEYGGSDPEPEFVDINEDNEAVVSLQENNHLAIVDLVSGQVTSHFDAGDVDLFNVDAVEDDVIALTDTLLGVPREPDAITWVPQGDGYRIATANEGDLFGGSRGFSLFDPDGNITFDSGSDFEALAVRHGHYPEGRSENKGSEPEAIEYGRYGDQDYLFVASERGSFVAVYLIDGKGQPVLAQVLPAPLAPEGLLAIPSRGLLVVSGEADDPDFGVRSTVMIYRLGDGEPTYPQILSADDASGQPIPWSALSGMTARGGGELLAVWDSYYSESRIFTIDANQTPAVITDVATIEGGTGDFDPEGIVVAPDGSYWIASEGNASGTRPNRLLQTSSDGTLLQEITLPDEITACRAASTNRGSLGAGFEGLTTLRTGGEGFSLLVAQQRGWDYTTPECEALDDDPADLNKGEPTQTRLWAYDPVAATWDNFAYELEAVPQNASWVGLSEITSVGGGFIVIERDNRTGNFAQLKTLVYFPVSALSDGVVTRDEKRVYDVLPELLKSNGWVSDKPEGLAVSGPFGILYLVTDNDGVDDWSGETSFLKLGPWWSLFSDRL